MRNGTFHFVVSFFSNYSLGSAFLFLLYWGWVNLGTRLNFSHGGPLVLGEILGPFGFESLRFGASAFFPPFEFFPCRFLRLQVRVVSQSWRALVNRVLGHVIGVLAPS